MIITTVILGIICLLYAFTVDIMSDITKPTPTRASVVLGIGIALVLAGIGSAHADEWEDNSLPKDSWKNVSQQNTNNADWSWYEPWRTQDTVRESVYLAITTVDLLQTHQIVEQHLREQNPFLGTYPSMARVNESILVGMLFHYEVAKALPQVPRTWFQYWFIFVETTAIGNNYGMGLHVKF